MSIHNIYISVYNLLHGGSFKTLYQEVNKRNGEMIPFSQEEVSQYLKSWGFKDKIIENPLMTKDDIIVWRKKTGADQKASVFAYTGGSTGQSLKIPLSKKRAAIRKSTLLYYNGILDYKLGDKYLFIRAKDRNYFLKKLRNEYIFVPKNTSKEKLNRVIELISSNNIKYIFGYPSVISELALHLIENERSNNSIKGIICASEPVYSNQIEIINKAFNCSVLNRYGIEEVGVIAHQRATGGDLLVDRFGLFVEVLDTETLQPVSKGQEGKLVVTDLNADLFPIIRYDTGDTAIVSEYSGDQVYSLKKVLGREVEKIFQPDGTPVSSLALGPGIYKPFSNNGYTCNFQFAQISQENYELRVKRNQETIDDTVIKEVLRNLKKILGNDSNIKVTFVNQFNTRKSGKVPIYVNEFSEK